MRVRRSSDNAESDIGHLATLGANGNYMLDTAALLAFTGGGNGFVVTWYDQTGSGANATQSVAASQPTIVTSGVVETMNGYAAPKFGGANVYMTGTGYAPFNSTTPVSMVSVLNITSAPAAAYPGYFGNLLSLTAAAGGAQLGTKLLLSEMQLFRTSFTATSFTAVKDPGFNTPTVMTWECPTGITAGTLSSTLRLNGGASGSASAGSFGAQSAGYVIGSSLLVAFLKASIPELISYSTVLTTEQRQAIERSQGNAFGITVA